MNGSAIGTRVLAIVFLIGLMHGAWVQAQESAAEFYKKNPLIIVVPFGPGGGTDFYGRTMSAFWPDVTDGATALVKNVPGGATLLAMNSVYAAKPDGRTIAIAPSGTSLTIPVLFENPAVKFDLNKVNWIGMIPYDPVTFAVGKKSKYNSIAELQKANPPIKGGHIEGSPSMGVAVAYELLSLTNGKVIIGYTSSPDVGLALGRGELEATAVNQGSIKQYMDTGLVKPAFLTLDFKRTDLMADVPAVPEVVKLAPKQEHLLRNFVSLHGGLVVWAPPGVPEDRLQYLRESFKKLLATKGLVTHMKQRMGMWLPPRDAKQTKDEIMGLMTADKGDIDYFKSVVKKFTQ